MTSPAIIAFSLAKHIDRIATNELAGDCFKQVQESVARIERMINRPIPPRILGPCPAWVADRQQCGVRLVAERWATQVICPNPSCRKTHNVEELIASQTNDIEGKSFTVAELYKTILPVQELYVPLRTLQHWAARGKLMPTGYSVDREPRYMLREVRELWESRPQRGPTGAAAHRKAS